MFSVLRNNRQNVLVITFVIASIALLASRSSVGFMDVKTFLDFLFVTLVAACYPLKLGSVKRMNIYWLVIPILYLYGPVAMLIFYQLAILFFLFTSRTKEGNFLQYPIYALVFFVGPFVSYGLLKLIGFEFIELPFIQMFITNTLFYGVFLVFSSLVYAVYYKDDAAKPNKNIHGFQELLNSLLFILLGTALYSFILVYGRISILIALVFYVIIARLSRNHDATMQKSNALENVMDLQMNFDEYVTKQQLKKAFMQKVMNVTGAQRVLVVRETELHFVLKNDQLQKSFVKRCQQQMLQRLFAAEQIYYINKRAYSHLGGIPEMSESMESFLAMPMCDVDEPAMLLLESDKRFAFEKGQIELCELLITAYQTALQHQSKMEETRYKSERCALTNLYNYRYLTEYIQNTERQLAQRKIESISTIILDIDHFKQLNDTYGHENGNIILKEFAKRLEALVADDAVLARYGGEEFVVLLPNKSSQAALKMAEEYRQAIECSSFQVERYEQQKKELLDVQVTVSIGVANIPEHTNNLSDLMTFADKALYVGAKQAGRNRVAVFNEPLSN